MSATAGRLCLGRCCGLSGDLKVGQTTREASERLRKLPEEFGSGSKDREDFGWCINGVAIVCNQSGGSILFVNSSLSFRKTRAPEGSKYQCVTVCPYVCPATFLVKRRHVSARPDRRFDAGSSSNSFFITTWQNIAEKLSWLT